MPNPSMPPAPPPRRTRQLRASALVAALALAGAAWQCPSQEVARPRVTCDPAYRKLADTVAATVDGLGLPGGALLLVRDGRTVCEGYFGAYTERTAVPVISAAKWLSAATILTLVDDGTLRLDDPVSKYLPYATSFAGTVTLRQLLSHTSGFPSYHDCMFDRALTLDACARRITALNLLAPPGTEFRYGGAAFTVAGRMAEAASGRPWADLFRERMAEPLGMRVTWYGNTENPVLSEGWTVSTLREYGAFVRMVADGGIARGRRVLSSAALREMERDQRAGTTTADSPRGGLGYGLGVWRDSVDDAGEAVRLSSPGGGGFVPWIDRAHHVVGVVMFSDRIERVWPTVQAVIRGVK